MGRTEDLNTEVSLEVLEVLEVLKILEGLEVLEVLEGLEVVRTIQTRHCYWPWILRVSGVRPWPAWPASRRASS